MTTSYRRLSKRAQGLLASGEGKSVEYKEHVKGLHPEDLVAFANSPDGGAILLGVAEATDSNGAQIGHPIGHAIDDESRLQIMGKALSCSPPVQIELFTENLDAKTFYRIEIASGRSKPYATNSGTYKIRDNGRNSPLLPEQLLTLFLEREAGEFNRRFSEATAKLTSQMSRALDGVANLESVITEKIESIGSSLGWAEYKAGDAADTIETVQAQVASLSHEMSKQSKRLRAISRKVEADDPVKQAAREEVLAYLIEELNKKPEIVEAASKGEAITMTLTGSSVAELTEKEMNEVFAEAALKVRSKGTK